MVQLMNDQELLERATKARGAAHRSSMSEIFEVNANGKPTGIKKIADNGHASGWIFRGHELCELAAEIRRRGLALPPCDCPTGAHDNV